ncbi:MAG TPA: hypothetical protein VGW77_01530 [Candidatus Binatia bacterium]|jgi:hypothetical protein|nr:hypothetical protein [Candidatus Binatia bacterium]
MDSTNLPRFEAMTTGVLLDRAFRLYTSNFSLMLGITAAAYVPFYLIMVIIESRVGINVQAPSGGLSTVLFQIVFMILWASIAFPIASGAATYAISERYLGNEVTIGEALRLALSRFWTLSIAQITATIRVMFGLLLIVPGILWMLSYALIVPAVLIEGQNATPSLRRSRDLVKGHRGKVFCVMFIVNLLQGILALGVSMVSGMIFSSDSAGGAVLNSAMNNLLSIFLTPLGIVATILLYYDMRIRKEGFDLEMLSRAITPNAESVAAVPTPSR